MENGPSVDRIARVEAGVNYGWDGSDASMHTNAAYVWAPAVAPVNIAWIQPGTFSGSGFPTEKMDHLFATESGPTYGAGPQLHGKRISEFVFDAAGVLVAGPTALIEYEGVGTGTAVGLAAGPDGLYFTDLYKDFGAASPIEAGASVFRVRWIGVVEFSGGVAGRARASHRRVPRRLERAVPHGVALGVRRRHRQRREGAGAPVPRRPARTTCG